MTTRSKPFAFPTLPLKLYKVSTASVKAGKVLSKSAKKWDGIYVPVLGIIIAADPVPDFYGSWKDGQALAAQQTVCGIKARNGAPTMSRLEYALVIEDGRCSPAVDERYFRFGPNKWEWTSTSCSPSDFAWAVNLDYGFSGRLPRSLRSRVRAVCPSQVLRTSVRGA